MIQEGLTALLAFVLIILTILTTLTYSILLRVRKKNFPKNRIAQFSSDFQENFPAETLKGLL